MKAKELLVFNQDHETEYFTKAAEVFDAIQNGTCNSDIQREVLAMNEFNQKTVVDDIFKHLEKVIRNEGGYLIKKYCIPVNKTEDLISIINQVMVEKFPSYNKGTDVKYCISTFIRTYTQDYLRVLMKEEHEISEAHIHKQNMINKAIYEISVEENIREDKVTPQMVHDKLYDKYPISVSLITDLMNRTTSLSIDEMITNNSVRLEDDNMVGSVVEDQAIVVNLTPKVRKLFDELFKQMKDRDWLVFAKNIGYYGDETQKMLAEEFVDTALYKKVAGVKESQTKEQVIEGFYNRSKKVNKIMKAIPTEIKRDYIFELDQYIKEQAKRVVLGYKA